MTTSWRRLQRQFSATIQSNLPQRAIGWTGWADGSLIDAARPNYIRVMFQDGGQAEAWNDGVPAVGGLQVDLYTDPDYPGLLRAKQPRLAFSKDFPFVAMRFHAPNHTWPGPDTVAVELRQFMPFHPSVMVFALSIRSGWMALTSGMVLVSPAAIDMATHKPTSGARYALVSIDETGTVAITDGAVIASGIFGLTLADIPSLPAGHLPICAVRLYAGQVAIKDTATSGNDLIDLRLSAFGSDKQPLSAELTDIAALTPADGDIIVWNGSTWTAAAPTGGGDVATDAIWAAKGDLAVGTGADTAAVLSAGADGKILSADSAEATGLKWVTPSAGDVPSTRSISTTTPLAGGGDLSADRTLSISAATTSAAGSMSSADKTKLDGIATGANNYAHPTGSVQMYAGRDAPAGWLACDGSAVARSTYADLYAVVGILYGAGDGSTTFNLPDMRGRTAIGVGQGTWLTNRTLGGMIGAETHQLSVNEMPSHSHTQNAHNHTQNAHNHTQDAHNHTQNAHNHEMWNGAQYVTGLTSSSGTGSAPSSAGISFSLVTGSQTATNNAATATNQNTTATNQSTTATNQSSGRGYAHNNVQPSLVLNYIIKT